MRLRLDSGIIILLLFFKNKNVIVTIYIYFWRKMLNQVLDSFKPAMPTISFASAAVGLFVGRNFFRAAGCKIVSIAARTLGKNPAEWDEASDKYLKRVQKNAFRDLTVVSSCLVLAFISHSAGQDDHFREKEAQKLESGFINDYAIPALKGYGIIWISSAVGVVAGWAVGSQYARRRG
jgi:hypothetical protein